MKHIWYAIRGLGILILLMLGAILAVGVPAIGFLWAIHYFGGENLITGVVLAFFMFGLLMMCYEAGTDSSEHLGAAYGVSWSTARNTILRKLHTYV